MTVPVDDRDLETDLTCDPSSLGRTGYTLRLVGAYGVFLEEVGHRVIFRRGRKVNKSGF